VRKRIENSSSFWCSATPEIHSEKRAVCWTAQAFPATLSICGGSQESTESKELPRPYYIPRSKNWRSLDRPSASNPEPKSLLPPASAAASWPSRAHCPTTTTPPFAKRNQKQSPKKLDSQANLSQQNINEKDPMPRSSLESTHPVPVTSIVEMPQCLVRHSPSSFAVRVAPKRERRALERQDSRNYRPARWSRPSRAREMNERSVGTTDLPDGIAGG
jgi:hypothetical protein